MIAIIGLGNPSDKYENTKHNAGFWVVDQLAKRWKISFQPGKGEYVFAQHNRREILIVKPTTSMNQSGTAVKDVVTTWHLLPSDIYVVVDDVDLPLGSIRIRPKGGDGCHRGMENVIYHLQSDQFSRVRFGIGTDENMRPAEKYVLKPFKADDKPLALEMVNQSADALESIFTRGLNRTMNQFNT